MTNERAIQILESLISIDGDVIIEGVYKEALEMAIRSLQQEQPSEDLEKEFNKWLRGVVKSYGGDLPYFGEYGLFCVARRFYKLGKKSN